MLKIFLLEVLLILALCGNVFAQTNNSRVTVIVLEDSDGEIIHNETIRGALNSKLLEMGFKPVIDIEHAIKLNDAELLNNVYKGYPEEFISRLDNVTDYLVIGRCVKSENAIFIMDYNTGQMVESPLQSVKANLKVDVIVYDTGEILDTFSVTGTGFANALTMASDKAVDIATNQATEKLADAFKKISARSTYQISFKILASDENTLEKILDEINGVDAVNFMHVYERRGNTAALSIESYYLPDVIVKQLKAQTSLIIHVDKMSASSCTLSVTDEEVYDEKNFDDDDFWIDSSD